MGSESSDLSEGAFLDFARSEQRERIAGQNKRTVLVESVPVGPDQLEQTFVEVFVQAARAAQRRTRRRSIRHTLALTSGAAVCRAGPAEPELTAA